MAWIKSTFGAALTAAVTTAIGILVTLWLQAFLANPSPKVEVSRVDLPRLGIFNVMTMSKEQSQALGKLLGFDDVSTALTEASIGTPMIAQVKITNRSDRRSKGIEVVGDRIVVAFVPPVGISSAAPTVLRRPKSIDLGPLGPGVQMEVFAVIGGTYVGRGFPLSVLHDGVVVEPATTRLEPSDDRFGVLRLVLETAPASAIVILGLVLFAAAVGGGTLWLYVTRENFKLLIGVLNSGEIERRVKFADYVRKEFPEKLPAQLRGSVLPPAGDQSGPPGGSA